jgi:crotonobetainyl-CoA:carnitine CoA-transferase CaiB-like acyl-CoA transferase
LNMFHQSGLRELHMDPAYGVFRTKDGKQLSLGIAYEDWFWKDLCRVLEMEEYRDMPFPDRRADKEEITRCLKNKFRDKTMEEWLEAFKGSDVPVAPVKDLEEVVDDPHIKSRNLIDIRDLVEGESTLLVNFPVKFSEMSPKPAAFVSKLGEHGFSVLKEIGFSEKEIESMRERGVI